MLWTLVKTAFLIPERISIVEEGHDDKDDSDERKALEIKKLYIDSNR